MLLAVRPSTGDADLDRVAPRVFDVDPRARGAAVELLEALCPADGADRYRDRIAALRTTADPSPSLACVRALDHGCSTMDVDAWAPRGYGPSRWGDPPGTPNALIAGLTT